MVSPFWQQHVLELIMLFILHLYVLYGGITGRDDHGDTDCLWLRAGLSADPLGRYVEPLSSECFAVLQAILYKSCEALLCCPVW